MKVARFEDGQVVIDDEAVREPRQDEARLRMHTAGVCHSDLHLARGHWEGMPSVGKLGHEGIGVVEALGPGADRFIDVGDRVIVGLGGSGGGYWCGACEFCLGGEPRLCSQTRGIIGTFAEQFNVYAKSLVKLPDSIGDEEAPLACGGLTAYGAVKKLWKHGVLPGRRVAVIGAAGGLGHYAVQIAQAFGYKVVGVDVGADRLEFIESLGADVAVDASEAAERVRGEMGGVDACLVFAARMAGFDLGFQLLRRGGVYVAVGIPPASEGPIQLKPWDFFRMGYTVMYSAVGNVQDMRELVDMAAEGKVKSHIGRVGPLSELPAMFDELDAGAYVGRAVITDLAG
ncbi:MAG: zinc-binding dehydrogenase [Acidimicrobiales bacterium]